MHSIPEFVSAYQQLQQARDRGDADFQWRVDLENVLRRVYEAWPTHTNAWQVRARVVLVDQYLNANLGGYDDKESRWAKAVQWKVAKKMVEENVDDLIRPMTQVAVFNATSLPVVVDVHAALVEVVRLVIVGRREQSFCSKYLSVPFPNAVPRFDSKAREVSAQLVGHRIDESLFADAVNKEYAQHCQRIIVLLDELRSGGVPNPELPLLDHLLWAEGGGYA